MTIVLRRELEVLSEAYIRTVHHASRCDVGSGGHDQFDEVLRSALAERTKRFASVTAIRDELARQVEAHSLVTDDGFSHTSKAGGTTYVSAVDRTELAERVGEWRALRLEVYALRAESESSLFEPTTKILFNRSCQILEANVSSLELPKIIRPWHPDALLRHVTSSFPSYPLLVINTIGFIELDGVVSAGKLVRPDSPGPVRQAWRLASVLLEEARAHYLVAPAPESPSAPLTGSGLSPAM